MPGGTTFDDDGDVVMAVNQPVFEFIQAPKLVDWSQAAIVKWRKDRVQYKARVRQRCADSGETYHKILESVKNSIETKLLEIVCLYELKTAVEKVEDAQLLRLIDERAGSVMNEHLPDLDEFFKKHLNMDMKESDIDARVLKYYCDFSALIESHGFGRILGVGRPSDGTYEDRVKMRCTILLNNLEPQVLRDNVLRHVKYECREGKKNDFTLFGIIKERARFQHKYQVMNMENRQKAGKRQEKRATAKDYKPKHAVGSEKPKASAASGPPSRESSPPSRGCLHCGGAHWLRECPTDTADDRTKAHEKLRAQREAGKERSKAVRTSATGLPKVDEVLINGLVTAPYCADSGSDSNILPHALLDELLELESAVVLTEVDPPVIVTVAGGSTLECSHEAVVDIKLYTAAGAVRISRVAYLIMEGEEAEFLLGDKTLKSLGIDVDRQLEQLAVGVVVADDDPFDPVEDDGVDDIDSKLGVLLEQARQNGLSKGHFGALCELVNHFHDIFAEDIGSEPPATVEPLRIQLKPDAVPFRAKPRKYSPAQRDYLVSYTKKLGAMGYIYKNNQSRWASAAVPVAKPGRAMEYRMTIDYRPVNRWTVPIAGAAPNMATITPAVEGACGVADFDMPKSFWQFPLHIDSQEMMSYITEDTVYTPTRVPQGGMDSSTHFQNQMQTIFRDMLYTNLLIWIDDILVFAKSPEQFLEALQRFFECVCLHGLRLSVNKSSLFKKSTKWCGRIISGTGMAHDPSRLQALVELPLPKTGADLQQFVCAAGWLRDSLIGYARVVQPLHEKLEGVLSAVGRTRRLAAGVTLEWSGGDVAAFEAVKSLISCSQPLAFPHDDADLCVFTDASELGWGLIVTQVNEWQSGTPAWEQQHVLLVCKSGVFSGAERNWAIIDKEAYPIMWACKNLDYLLLRQGGFHLYCDHKNLIHLFDPVVELKCHVRGRLQRWALALVGLPYTIEHLDGVVNVWGDLLSRWGLPASGRGGIMVRCKVATHSQAARQETTAPTSRLRPRMDAFIFPTYDEIVRSQKKHRRLKPSEAVCDANDLVTVNSKVWLPEADNELLQRVMIVSHCGAQGHRGLDPMMATLQRVFFVRNIQQLCRRFLSRCLLCKHVKGGNIVPQPWGPTVEAKRRNEVLHWDYLFLGDGMGDTKYVLALKDDLTHFCELIACDSASSEVAVAALMDWCKRFGPPEVVMSDMGSHFKNVVLSDVCKRLGIEQNFVVAYTPWVNGSIERLNRDILQVLRVMLMEHQLDTREWVYLLPVVQSNLNHTAVASLSGRTPSELFTVLPAPNPLEVMVMPDIKEVATIDPVTSSDNLERLRTALYEMHHDVTAEKDKRRIKNQQRSNGTPCNFAEGDFVLWSRIDARLSNTKLLARWVGPFEVTEALAYSFMIRHLITGKLYNVHGSRLKFFSDSSLNVNEEMLAHVGNQGMVLEIEQLKDHRFAKTRNEWQLLISWVGLQADEDSWESLKSMTIEVPLKVAEYVEKRQDEALQSAFNACKSRVGTD